MECCWAWWLRFCGVETLPCHDVTAAPAPETVTAAEELEAVPMPPPVQVTVPLAPIFSVSVLIPPRDAWLPGTVTVLPPTMAC